MSPASLRLITDLPATGPFNMAADELLLEQAAAGQAAVRLYGWRPTTLSLGYFQPAAERLRNPAWRNLSWVRRSTGGGAILHDEAELTYTIALPPAISARHSHADWHCLWHRLMAAELRRHDMAAEVVGGTRPKPTELDFLCFSVPQPGDVMLAGRKVIGGAQRLRSGAILQHGSITPPAAEALREALPALVARQLELELEPTTWTPADQARIAELVADKYGTAAWNEKR